MDLTGQPSRPARSNKRNAGRNGARKWRGVPGGSTAEDLVDRIFRHERPNQLWLTDITEHPTREGKVYCQSRRLRGRTGLLLQLRADRLLRAAVAAGRDAGEHPLQHDRGQRIGSAKCA